MFTKATVWLVAACSILIVQASDAYEVTPCGRYRGKIISFEMHNCPNKTAEYCEIGQKDTLSWDIKYTNGVTYEKERVHMGIQYEDSFLSEFDQCKEQPEFCPGHVGEERAYHFEFELGDLLPKTGVVAPLTLYSSSQAHFDIERYIVCVKLPVKFYEI